MFSSYKQQLIKHDYLLQKISFGTSK